MIHRKNIATVKSLDALESQGYHLIEKTASYSKAEQLAADRNKVYMHVMIVLGRGTPTFYVLAKTKRSK